MKGNHSTMTPTNSTPDLTSAGVHSGSQSNPKIFRRSSVSCTVQRQNSYASKQRRTNPSTLTNDFLTQSSSPSFSTPVLTDAINIFFQATKTMEEEIMLPSRLKDMPVEGMNVK